MPGTLCDHYPVADQIDIIFKKGDAVLSIVNDLLVPTAGYDWNRLE
jgi:hypothetical protein